MVNPVTLSTSGASAGPLEHCLKSLVLYFAPPHLLCLCLIGILYSFMILSYFSVPLNRQRIGEFIFLVLVFIKAREPASALNAAMSLSQGVGEFPHIPCGRQRCPQLIRKGYAILPLCDFLISLAFFTAIAPWLASVCSKLRFREIMPVVLIMQVKGLHRRYFLF